MDVGPRYRGTYPATPDPSTSSVECRASSVETGPTHKAFSLNPKIRGRLVPGPCALERARSGSTVPWTTAHAPRCAAGRYVPSRPCLLSHRQPRPAGQRCDVVTLVRSLSASPSPCWRIPPYLRYQAAVIGGVTQAPPPLSGRRGRGPESMQIRMELANLRSRIRLMRWKGWDKAGSGQSAGRPAPCGRTRRC